MFHIAICDDNAVFLSDFKKNIMNIMKNLYIPYTIEDFTSVTDFRKDLEEGKRYQLVFLDIEFPDCATDGIDVAGFIRNQLAEAAMHIVFISSQPQYAMRLFDYQPFHFLIKPIQPKQLTNILSKSVSLWNCNNQTLQFFSGRENITLKIQHIIYIESFGRQKQIHCTFNEIYEVNTPFSKLLSELKPYDFISPHKSFIINYNKVKIWHRDSVIMENGEEIPISRAHQKKIQEFQIQHTLTQEG